MKVNVSELTGRQLNYAVAVCLWGEPRVNNDWFVFDTGNPDVPQEIVRAQPIRIHGDEFDPQGNWAHGGPIIEMHDMQINVGPYGCSAKYFNPDLDQFEGPDFEQMKPLVASMQCIVFALHEKDEIEIPDELCEVAV